MSSRTVAIVALSAVVAAVGSGVALASSGGQSGSTVSTTPMQAYYDGHRDSILSTDVSDQSLAQAENINFAPGLRLVPLSTPKIYFVMGNAAPGQLHVLSSQPGESDYSPIWRETDVSFKSGRTPVLLTSDTQVEALVKQGVLSEHKTDIRRNCPVVAVGS
jgi:hypothetical protein